MIDPDAEWFAESCGALAPVGLRIERDDGLLLAEGDLEFPFALIGQDQDVEVTLNHPTVSRRHACLQVIGGRVLVADLGSQSGVHGTAGGPGYAWLTPAAPIRIGPFHLTLRSPISVSPTPLDRVPNPLQPAPPLLAKLPKVKLKFLNGRSETVEWQVNRVLSFVGSSKYNKISLADQQIEPIHCYLLLTPTGLWIVDMLTENGTWVNGRPIRLTRLHHKDEVQVGRFRMACLYPMGEPAVPPINPPTGYRLAMRPQSDPGLYAKSLFEPSTVNGSSSEMTPNPTR